MMIYDMEASGKRLKALRKQAEKTQEQVAEAVGLEPGTISRIERGVKGMSIDSLLMFSEIYGVSTDYILKGNQMVTSSDTLLEELGHWCRNIRICRKRYELLIALQSRKLVVVGNILK